MTTKNKRKLISMLKFFELFTVYQLYDKSDEEIREEFEMAEYHNVL